MKKARFTSLARAELLAEIAYYETLRKGLGARFREQVEETRRAPPPSRDRDAS